MTQEQILSAVRWLMATLGPVAVSHGYVTSGTWEVWVGIAVSATPLIWGLVSKTEAAMVAAVNKLPTVKGVVTAPTVEGAALATAVSAPGVAPAGTSRAQAIAS